MEKALTPQEVQLAVKSARVAAIAALEDHFPAVVELQGRLADRGYLEVVQGLRQAETELGIPYTKALGHYQEMVRAEGQLAEVRRQKALEDEELSAARQVRQKEERLALAARERREAEERELARLLEEVGLVREEAAALLRLNRDVEGQELTLELLIKLGQEVISLKGTERKSLAEAVGKYAGLERARATLEPAVAQLEGRLQELRGMVPDLEQAVAFRQAWKLLAELLTQWKGIFMWVCARCGAHVWADGGHPGVFPPYCPCCGSIWCLADDSRGLEAAHRGQGERPPAFPGGGHGT